MRQFSYQEKSADRRVCPSTTILFASAVSGALALVAVAFATILLLRKNRWRLVEFLQATTTLFASAVPSAIALKLSHM